VPPFKGLQRPQKSSCLPASAEKQRLIMKKARAKERKNQEDGKGKTQNGPGCRGRRGDIWESVGPSPKHRVDTGGGFSFRERGGTTPVSCAGVGEADRVGRGNSGRRRRRNANQADLRGGRVKMSWREKRVGSMGWQ